MTGAYDIASTLLKDAARVTGTQSALLILTALTSSWLIVSPASARRIIGSLTSAGESISSRAVPSGPTAVG